jgi:hypothetical protein
MANLRAHNKDNYKVAKKVQLYARPKDSVAAADWISLGSVKNVQMDTEQTTLEHFTNYLGARAKDREEIIERRHRINFTLEEFNVPNLKLALGRGFRASEGGTPTKDVKYEKTLVNPGAGETIDLEKTDIKNVVVRSVGLEADTTYDEIAFADSTEVTAGGDWNNVTSPLTVVDAVTDYPAITFAVGKLIRIGTEILRVTAIAGADVTFARAQLGTVNAVHADGVAIFDGTGDYSVNLTTGIITILWAAAGALEDEATVPKIHVFFEQEQDVEEFELFDGEPIECQLQFQYGKGDEVEQVFGPYANAILKNNGPIQIGDGSDWQEMPMQAEITVEAGGSFGTIGVVKETQS